VSVRIQGRTVEEVFVIQRQHLRDGSSILTIGSNDQLNIRDVEVVWQSENEVLITGIAPGSRMVISDLPAPVKGMSVRIADDKKPEASPSTKLRAPSPSRGSQESGENR
jgi:hypothetical protein